MAKLALYTLLALFSASHLSSALQVTPDSPCSSVCQDSPDLDASDPNSSTTKNSDITCKDAAYSGPVGTKFQSCMACLQTSTFSQGSESDTMWFLYNLRYTAAYCVFGFPNATDVQSTPCTTSTACGMLKAAMEHGIQDPKGTTAYSYCSAGDGHAMDFTNFDTCIPCLSAEGKNDYLANYFRALDAGCRQQPALGTLLGLSDTIFSETEISIVDPASLNGDEDGKPGLTVPVIVGIVVGVIAFLLIAAGITFVCLRRRRNKRVRASAQADYYAQVNNRHHSSMSFQCQTHMASPRLWPGTEEGLSTPMAEHPDFQPHRSSTWKPPYPQIDEEEDTTTTTATTTAHPTHHHPKPPAHPTMPLHITTTIPPTPPPQAYTSPSSAERTYHSPSDFRSPLSAESVRSTSALLPALRPYVPAEHGVHTTAAAASPTASTTTTSPATAPGTGMTPLLRSQAWPLPASEQTPGRNRESGIAAGRRPVIRLDSSAVDTSVSPSPPPPPPPQLKTSSSRGSGVLAVGGRKSPRVTGSPVESWEIRTAFAAPPGRR
ncbi:uncharacterized protein B0H64DRAFT_355066 [Chaetomium fimeti]|uniref:LPXTG-domain-containing protein n=1 Tax=Chaetomium fimeti TaxID=1854472 RepID=A0AAE0LVH9_9PEZI|nr:hypothetical protein B0H64DRAFT_355066 [Chaetomium fimeti]